MTRFEQDIGKTKERKKNQRLNTNQRIGKMYYLSKMNPIDGQIVFRYKMVVSDMVMVQFKSQNHVS